MSLVQSTANCVLFKLLKTVPKNRYMHFNVVGETKFLSKVERTCAVGFTMMIATCVQTWWHSLSTPSVPCGRYWKHYKYRSILTINLTFSIIGPCLFPPPPKKKRYNICVFFIGNDYVFIGNGKISSHLVPFLYWTVL